MLRFVPSPPGVIHQRDGDAIDRWRLGERADFPSPGIIVERRATLEEKREWPTYKAMEGKEPTPKQVAMLKRHHLFVPPTRAEASHQISELMASWGPRKRGGRSKRRR